MARNFLLGYGEALTSNLERPDSGPIEKFFYDYQENKDFLLPKLYQLEKEFKRLPEMALTNGKVVGKLTIHPTHLAKSYYPKGLLSKFSISNIGSKEVKVKPRRVGTKNKKELYSTNCLYISLSKESLAEFIAAIESDSLNTTHRNDFCKLEDIRLFEGQEKIIGDVQGSTYKFEFAFHTPNKESSQVLAQFSDFSKYNGCTVDHKKGISVDGLSFLSVTCDKLTLTKLSEYSYLRSIRKMPEIGLLNPVSLQENKVVREVKLPDTRAENDKIKVAIFDGGIGGNTLSKWVQEHTFSDVQPLVEHVTHGSEVTSLLLFGPVEYDQTELPVPYANIDHYRVIDPLTDRCDLDSLDVLQRILSVISKKHYDFINLSIGPRNPIEDDEVHSWTSALEPYLVTGKTLMSVAVGNDGVLGNEMARIQSPSDMVNAIAVGASSSDNDDFWSLANYSSIGPGRSPGLMKPDVVAFGGSSSEPVEIYSPLTDGVHPKMGTSYAAPSVLRQAIAIKASIEKDISPLVSKTLLIHRAHANGNKWQHVGWGKVRSNIDDILYTQDNEATIIYERELLSSKYIKAPVPLPEIGSIKGKVYVKATLCYATKTDPQHPYSYTRSGVGVVFRPMGDLKDTVAFFSKNTLHPRNEQELRMDGHKWENTLSNEVSFEPEELKNPCFEINHQEREEGGPSKGSSLPFVLIITVRAENTPKLYDHIVQKYQVLQPLRTRTKVSIPLR
ncbi:S8 family peptidase [Pseudoalteromonas fuliginea]|uniref:S8 family peptidase n=1 Tax=Pseudoalteromonas fuliginea TaxID=1872678 RepID=A0ABQ6RLM2_9GAMM|nr:S8 family peptidase [Pseudoalteromonas fuliginea]KAA1163377.1 S8 family peptidase [Pseudoalteromonas fuliginea]KAA1168662.1 S8 family peptidase [Pseudoalteromonas fuliginea]